jgi:hypothetical protein
MTVVATLMIYLLVSIVLRRRAEWLRRRHHLSKAIDVSAIAPQVQRVRQDHLAALHSRPHPTAHGARLIAAARLLIVSLPCFRRTRTEDEPQRSVRFP